MIALLICAGIYFLVLGGFGTTIAYLYLREQRCAKQEENHCHGNN